MGSVRILYQDLIRMQGSKVFRGGFLAQNNSLGGI